jgi:PEP-CTERM/exosortase A-associated glycosyltransferase
MRVLHILDHSLPLHSGYAFRTAAILREQRALGWETVQLTTPRVQGKAADSEEAEGLLFHRTARKDGLSALGPGGGYASEMAATAARIGELVARFRPEVLHAHSPVLTALPTLWAGHRHRLPVVYEVRALWEDGAVDHGTTREGSARYRMSRALETFALRRADHVTTICEGLRREIVARGVPQERVTVIPNAVDTSLFRFGEEPDAELRVRLGLEGKTVLGFAGSFYGYEGLDLMLEALAQLAPQRPDLRILLLGGGPQDEQLRSLAQRLGLADRACFVGRVPHHEVQRYYELIDILVYPRRRIRVTEMVTPLKPLEAMAQGRMLIASDVGGHKELIRDGETGFLFPADDARGLATKIDSVLRTRGEWPRLRAAARRFVETERNWRASVARYGAAYSSAMNPRQVQRVLRRES